MQYPKLELQIAQVDRLIASSRKKFTDKKKAKIYNNTLLLFEKIKNSNYAAYQSTELVVTKSILNLIYFTIEFLDYKADKHIPKRLIYCLNLVLDEWIQGGTTEYLIVVSYNKTPNSFFVQVLEQEQLNFTKLFLKDKYGVDYSQSLIQISKPRYYLDDYLSSVPLYHEIGHFIDKNYQVTKSIKVDADGKLLGHSKKHFAEFFADIFAAQYIGKCATAPLDELVKSSSESHPSNAERVEVVNTFVDGTGSSWSMDIVKELKRICLLRTERELEARYETLSETENPFVLLKPQILDNTRKLHSLFDLGWQHWLDSNSLSRKKFSRHDECSRNINMLIKNSIRLTMQQNERSTAKKMGNLIGNLARKYKIVKN